MAASQLLSKVKEMGLPSSTTALEDGTAVGNFSSTGNDIDILGYRIVKTDSPEQLKEYFSEYFHKPPRFVRNDESTIGRPWIEVVPLDEMTSSDPSPILDQAPDLRKRHGKDLYTVFAVVRYPDGTFDWRGW